MTSSIFLLIFLSILAFLSILYCFLLKSDIRSVAHSLESIRKTDTNALVVTRTFDPDVSALVNQINAGLEAQRQAVAAGEKMGQELKQAITNVSHDLKTPLTSALGYLQMAASGKTPPEKQAGYLAIVAKRLDYLSYLLEELFDFTKIYEGQIEIHRERVNVSNLLRDVLSLYYADFTGKSVTPVVNIPDQPVTIFADEALMKRIFQNLIQNALIHGTAYFAVGVEPGARLTFENSVENITALDASRLFERFYTVDISRHGKTTGLGLAICKALVERQGGTIQAHIQGDHLVICIDFK